MKRTAKLPILVFACHCASLTCAQSIYCGDEFTLALCTDGTLTSWGLNLYGQLGNGSNAYGSVPMPVSLLSDVVACSAGMDHAIAMRSDGSIYVWGRNRFGAFGNGEYFTESNVPVAGPALLDVHKLSAGAGHTMALMNDGTVWGWGSNFRGDLGLGTSNNQQLYPVQVSALTNVTDLSCGYECTFVIKADSTLWAFGSNFYGNLGIGGTTNSYVPVQVTSLSDIIAVACYEHTLALKADGTVWAWGQGYFGQLGNGISADSDVPVQVSNLTDIVAIDVGEDFSLALRADGTVWAWGRNQSGQLGNGTNSPSNVPLQISQLTGIVAIQAAARHGMAVANDGTVWAFGENSSGQLGIGNNSDSNVPLAVNGICPIATTVKDFSKEGELVAYPNPTTGRFTLAGVRPGDVLMVCDAWGREIQRMSVNGTHVNMDLRPVVAGVYILKLRANGQTRAIRLVKE